MEPEQWVQGDPAVAAKSVVKVIDLFHAVDPDDAAAAIHNLKSVNASELMSFLASPTLQFDIPAIIRGYSGAIIPSVSMPAAMIPLAVAALTTVDFRSIATRIEEIALEFQAIDWSLPLSEAGCVSTVAPYPLRDEA